MPEYRPLVPGELIREGDVYFSCDEWYIQYFRPLPESLLDALKDLIALGYNERFPKWDQWEETIAAQELVNEITTAGRYRMLKPGEIIQEGDEVKKANYSPRWSKSVALGRLVESQMTGPVLSYRRFINDAPPKITKAISAKLIEAMESLLYMGADEKYKNWEALGSVINARELIAKHKARRKK